MSAEGDDLDREFEATPQRLIEARRKGGVPQSADLMAAAGIAGFAVALYGFGDWAVQAAGTAGARFLDQADRLSDQSFARSGSEIGLTLLALAGPPMLLLALSPLAVLLLSIASRSLVFAPDRLAPRLSRISLIATARHKFGIEGMAEFGKSALKLGLVGTVLFHFLESRIEEIIASVRMAPQLSSLLLAGMIQDFLFVILLVGIVVGGADLLWQIHRFRLRNRMSRKEITDEFKESEGDPHLKSARRQRAQEVATNRMLQDVAKADVVVVNPTHYAVALKWDRSKGRAPVCTAKGVDEIAQRIRERAAEHGVPLHSDPPTARAIHATVEIGQEIRVEHYRAIAAAIRFADAMRKRVRRT